MCRASAHLPLALPLQLLRRTCVQGRHGLTVRDQPPTLLSTALRPVSEEPIVTKPSISITYDDAQSSDASVTSPQLSRTPPSRGFHDGAPARLRHRTVTPALVGAAMLLAGCAGNASGAGLDLRTPSSAATPGTVTAPVTISPSPVAPTATASTAPKASPTAAMSAEQQVLAQYRSFFASIRPIWLAPAATRKAKLAELAMDPQLRTLLKGMAAADRAGEVPYGDVSIKPKVVRLQAALATIEDCQDTSRNGRMKKATGRKVTIGRKGEPVLATMKRGTDDVWRVSSVDYQQGLTC